MADEALHGNEDAKPLRDYVVPTMNAPRSSIARPAVQANNVEIKPAIIQMIQTSIQFAGMPNDDPNAYIANFLEICDTFKQNDVSDNAIRLRLFPFSLRDKAKEWLGFILRMLGIIPLAERLGFAFDEAIAELDTLGEESYKDSTLITTVACLQ
ncbi:uncharacterized protein LOC127900267 [Citrus sinensis]|uniref:uncharacterized protein LOC127900267 n=1 Tax=Citrus sinensis TaxID=2711 RepID=UPI002279A027|nr:uncharacterized protein LOC127900267 [Citrus sinensis]